MSHMHHASFSAKYLNSTGKLLTSVAASLGYVAPEVLNEKGHGKPVDFWCQLVNRVGLEGNLDLRHWPRILVGGYSVK